VHISFSFDEIYIIKYKDKSTCENNGENSGVDSKHISSNFSITSICKVFKKNLLKRIDYEIKRLILVIIKTKGTGCTISNYILEPTAMTHDSDMQDQHSSSIGEKLLH
jgi:hypothetical protein